MPPGRMMILGPTFGSSDSHFLKAFWTSGEFGSIPFMLPMDMEPCPLGSGKLRTPFFRMHDANASITRAASACSAALNGGGDAGGGSDHNLTQSLEAALNNDEPGSTSAGIDTPSPDGVVGMPWVVMHAAQATLLPCVGPGVEAVDVGGFCSPLEVIARFATERPFPPPQPAARNARDIISAAHDKGTTDPIVGGSQPCLKWL
jgi:hypothetical protein